MIFKILATTLLRKFFFKGLYRKLPAAANVAAVFFESWNLALGAGFMFVRTVKLAIVTAFYIGRVDTPILAKGIDLIDRDPTNFLKDLVLHEAHRHPFIERLGAMYLIKLEKGKDFASRAGSCWRLMFVLALMPWLGKYRVRAYDIDLDLEIEELEEEMAASGRISWFSKDDNHEETQLRELRQVELIEKLVKLRAKQRERMVLAATTEAASGTPEFLMSTKRDKSDFPLRKQSSEGLKQRSSASIVRDKSQEDDDQGEYEA